MARGRVFCMASCRLMPFLGSVVLILFSATLCRFTTAQRTMCPCKTLKGSYCKYNLKNKSSVWPYTGTCYELDIRCDCINCPVDDPTGQFRKRRTCKLQLFIPLFSVFYNCFIIICIRLAL